MPTKSVPRMPLIHSIVVAALRDSGDLKAGTPLETASMPVMAVQPEEKAFRMSSTPTASAPGTGERGTPVAAGSCRMATRTTPMATNANSDTTKR